MARRKSTKKKSKKLPIRIIKWLPAASLALVILLIFGVYALRVGHVFTPNPAASTAASANSIFRYACTGKDDPESLLCLENSYQKYTQSHGVTAAFTKLKAAYNTDGNVKSYCHPLAHIIGRTAAEMYSENDIDKVYSQGDNFCWSGYYHGVMELIISRIGKNQVPAHIPTICAGIKAEKPYSFYHYNCVHGLGHGIMDVTSGDLIASLKLCDLLTDTWEQGSCYGGVFMQNVMDEINPDGSTSTFKSDQPMYPCTAVDSKYKEQCYLMQTSHALRSAGENFATVFKECSAADAGYIDTCYQSLGRDASGNSVSDVAQTKATCMLGQNEDAQSNCIIGAVKDFISYYHSDAQANNLCNALNASLQANCQETKKSYYATF